MKIETWKKYTTHDGRSVKILEIADGGSFPVFAEVTSTVNGKTTEEHRVFFDINGEAQHGNDVLVEVGRIEIKVGDRFKTRGRRDARIIAIIRSKFPIIAVISDIGGEYIHSYLDNGSVKSTDGTLCRDNDLILVENPKLEDFKKHPTELKEMRKKVNLLDRCLRSSESKLNNLTGDIDDMNIIVNALRKFIARNGGDSV